MNMSNYFQSFLKNYCISSLVINLFTLVTIVLELALVSSH